MGRTLLSILIAALLLLIGAANLPESELRRQIMRVGDPVLTAIGVRQVWSVFAPDPVADSIETEVRFRYADGTTATWEVPRGDAFISPYRDYRWLKFAENVNRTEAAIGLLQWAIAEHADQLKPLRSAALVRRSRPIVAPGRPRSPRPPWKERVVVELRGG